MSFIHVATAAFIDRDQARLAEPVRFLKPMDLEVVRQILTKHPEINTEKLWPYESSPDHSGEFFKIDTMFVRAPYMGLSVINIDASRQFLRDLQRKTGCSLFEALWRGERHIFKGFVHLDSDC